MSFFIPQPCVSKRDLHENNIHSANVVSMAAERGRLARRVTFTYWFYLKKQRHEEEALSSSLLGSWSWNSCVYIDEL